MKHKTAELTEDQLNTLLLTLENVEPVYLVKWNPGSDAPSRAHFRPATNWEDGGPIIERERITLIEGMGDEWGAFIGCQWSSGEMEICKFSGYGQTPLISAMRCYVASKLGEEVDLA